MYSSKYFCHMKDIESLDYCVYGEFQVALWKYNITEQWNSLKNEGMKLNYAFVMNMYL